MIMWFLVGMMLGSIALLCCCQFGIKWMIAWVSCHSVRNPQRMTLTCFWSDQIL